MARKAFRSPGALRYHWRRNHFERDMLKILTASDLLQEVQELFANGMPRGDRTKWAEVNRFYSVAPGYWTVITGVPSHGKSTWLDNLMIGLTIDHGWKWGIYSPENQPHEVHIASLAEKIIGKAISGPHAGRLSSADLNHAISIIDASWRFLALPRDAPNMANLDDVLEQFIEVLDHFENCPKVGLVIDPWNELDHTRPDRMAETEYISYQLSKWRQFHRVNNTHGFIVAHPMKLSRSKEGRYPIPDLYDINGSAHWKNKCDNGIVVWRDEDKPGTAEIHIKKVKFKHHGQAGMALLDYDFRTGIYYDSIPDNYQRLRNAQSRTFSPPEDE